MKIEFTQSFGDGPFAYLEGSSLDVPDPLPPRFLRYLQAGLVRPVKDLGSEIALEPAAIEHAIARRSRRSPRTRRRKAVAASSADGCP